MAKCLFRIGQLAFTFEGPTEAAESKKCARLILPQFGLLERKSRLQDGGSILEIASLAQKVTQQVNGLGDIRMLFRQNFSADFESFTFQCLRLRQFTPGYLHPG